jgi:hypothetical protein
MKREITDEEAKEQIGRYLEYNLANDEFWENMAIDYNIPLEKIATREDRLELLRYIYCEEKQ